MFNENWPTLINFQSWFSTHVDLEYTSFCLPLEFAFVKNSHTILPKMLNNE
jgi:hypothetical protein